MRELVVIHELRNPETGRTYKEDNLRLAHLIPVGTLVEIVADENEVVEADDEDWRGIRLHVIAHRRDCDGTPLYVLGVKGSPWSGIDGAPGNRAWGGWSEGSLRVVSKVVGG